ncbi:MAG: large extracellular alpha-helical protein, partial [Actinobacteria bacterium]|nr:large extracellular alpha-helical protein [Actinomycetota bacterium]
VDESFLALTGFKTPSLEGLARFFVPLTVSTAEMRTRLLLQTPYGFARLSPLTGGDGGESAAAAESKVRKDFNPVAYFNPALRTRPDGTAEVSFRLPDTMTAYRVYAVACDKGSGFASVQRELVVTKPFYLEPGLPAFLTRGDRFTLLVSSFNKTREPGKGTIEAGKDEFVRLSGAPASFELAPLDRILLPVQGEATSPGTARLRFSGTLGAYSDAVELQLPVNSGLLPWHDVVSGTLKGSETIRYSFPKGTEKISWKEVRPGEVRAVLTVSGSPFLRMAPGVRYLLHYPYGCVEQTSSGTIPLAALRELIRQGVLPGISLEVTDKFLRGGVERLLKMQLPDGSFSYWPGERHVHPWGAIYAMSALTFAKRSGFPVPEDRLARGVSFLSTWATSRDGSRDDELRAFAAFILALNKSLPDPLHASLIDRLPNLTREGALLTLLAGKHAGRTTEDIPQKVRALLERSREEKARAVFHARYREAAVALLAGTEFLPEAPVTGKLAAELLRGINPQGYWTSTSDTGWSLLALGEYYRGTSFSGAPVTVTVRQEGKPELSASVAPGKSHDFVLDAGAFLARPEASLSVSGNTTLLYLLDLTFPRMDYARSGHSNGFKIEKTITPIEGGKTIKVGDIVRVDVSFDTGFRSLEYVVLDDPLPAGLMAINSALKTEEHPQGRREEERGYWNYWDDEWGAYRFQPNHFELREDRVLAFRDRIWWGGKFRYSYFARAVLAGEFVLPSTKVQLMYEPDVAGYTPVGKLVIEAR